MWIKCGGMSKRKVISATTSNFQFFPEHFAFLIMTTELMISMLKQANTGTEMLNVLDAITDVDTEKETVVAAVMPSAGMILNHKGEEVVF